MRIEPVVVVLLENRSFDHPPGGTTPGELFLKNIYQALTGNEDLWRQTLLVITFDEHGGTYDHSPPPWGAIPPWEGGKPAPDIEHDFEFDRFGVRVPTLFVSPWVEPGTVLRADDGQPPFDHTSVIATVLDWQDIRRSDWTTMGGANYLGARAKNAPTFQGVLNAEAPRDDNLFAPLAVTGNELAYADRLYLQHVPSSDWIGPSKATLESGIRFYIPIKKSKFTSNAQAAPARSAPATSSRSRPRRR